MIPGTLVNKEDMGTVYWVTGFSGAGKTAIGTRLYRHLKEQGRQVAYLDGDILREVFGGIYGNDSEDRKKVAYCYSRLGRMLSLQGFDVVCATISMFHEVRDWNRGNLGKYKEIYVRVPIEVLIKRDQKQLYSRALKGEIKHVMGVDVVAEEPAAPDIVLDNDGSRNLDEVAAELFTTLAAC